ncbi:hypothetical protein BDZ94DRAFT_1313892 [Collybia nuda]|uniref:Uncharacterized protein n=1 Tax=Collybia nuda TaxID=64659 RepID=A0A9P5XY21_9AGAR|nr:hypothetical protein BDZ94DRAFT_1313892 [Collybia nuda]
MELHYELVARPISPQPNPGQPRVLPTTPPATRNATPSRPQAPTRSAAARSKALPKSGPFMETAKIRLIDTRYRYFISTGPHPGPLPINCDAELFEKGDLYIHRYTTDDMQVWLMEDGGAWRSVKSGHRHPILHKYFLNVLPDSGKPNWVLHETWKGVVKRNVVSTKT